MKPLSKARLSKKEREKNVLFGLIDTYIKNPQPIGSKTLKEGSFQEISSATIRNYFATLEEQGYLIQQHASGGRIPTEKAYLAYAEEYVKAGTLDEDSDQALKVLDSLYDKDLGNYLQKAIEILSEVTQLPVFLSSPRFDQDAITTLKLVSIDKNRVLCVILTELGLVYTETLYLSYKHNLHSLKRVEDALVSRLKNQKLTISLDDQEKHSVQKIYNEVMVRYIIGYTNFSKEDLYQTGLSNLLAYPEFNSAKSFASGLSLFENERHLRALIQEICQDTHLKYFIGKKLQAFCPLTEECAVLSLPYSINGKVVGAVGLLGAQRMPYRQLFGVLRAFCHYVSTALSQSMSKNQLSYRLPQDGKLHLDNQHSSSKYLLEDQSE